MAKRKDGKETRQKLLDAACAVFAEKGFREAKITEICRRAGANVAAVNYYFGDKDSLYVAAWRQAMEKFIAADSPFPPSLPAAERLRLKIHRIMEKILIAAEDSAYFRRIELMELANPTGLIDEAWKDLIAPRRQEMIALIREVIGPGASDETVKLCEMSIINQCRGYILLQKSRLETIDESALTPQGVAAIAEHITRFSLGGIQAVKAKG